MEENPSTSAAPARRGGPRRRLGPRHRQLHRLGLGLGERVGLVVDRIPVATREQARDPAREMPTRVQAPREDVLHDRSSFAGPHDLIDGECFGSGGSKHRDTETYLVPAKGLLGAVVTADAHAAVSDQATGEEHRERVRRCEVAGGRSRSSAGMRSEQCAEPIGQHGRAEARREREEVVAEVSARSSPEIACAYLHSAGISSSFAVNTPT